MIYFSLILCRSHFVSPHRCTVSLLFAHCLIFTHFLLFTHCLLFSRCLLFTHCLLCAHCWLFTRCLLFTRCWLFVHYLLFTHYLLFINFFKFIRYFLFIYGNVVFIDCLLFTHCLRFAHCLLFTHCLHITYCFEVYSFLFTLIVFCSPLLLCFSFIITSCFLFSCVSQSRSWRSANSSATSPGRTSSIQTTLRSRWCTAGAPRTRWPTWWSVTPTRRRPASATSSASPAHHKRWVWGGSIPANSHNQ